MKDCPYCMEMARRGIFEPIQALEHQMLVNNLWSQAVVNVLGYEQAKVVAAWVRDEADKAWKEKLG